MNSKEESKRDSKGLIPAYGGELKELIIKDEEQKLAVLEVSSKWEPDKSEEAEFCYGTNSLDHPAVKMIFNERGRYYIAVSYTHLTLPTILLV